MNSETTAFLTLLQTIDFPYKVIETGDDQGIWLPLAVALRKFQYRQPDWEESGLDHATLVKLLVGGRLQTCIELGEFARMFASFCQDPTVQAFGVAFINEWIVKPFQQVPVASDPESVMAAIEFREDEIARGNAAEPGLGNLLSLEGSRFAMVNGKPVLSTSAMDFSTDESTVESFLKVHPEWAQDVILTQDHGYVYTLAASLALAKFFAAFGYGDPEKVQAFQEYLTEQILESGGDFGPKAG